MNAFDTVKQRLTMPQVVAGYGFTLNRAGRMPCPFHNGHDANMSVKQDFYKCFVCNEGGDCINFTAKLFGLSNIDAVKKLNDDFSLGLNFGKDEPKTSRLRAYANMRKNMTERNEREQIKRAIERAHMALAEYHRILWKGKIHEEPFSDWYCECVHRLDYSEYMLDCFDEDAEKWTRENQKEVARIEQFISGCDKQRR